MYVVGLRHIELLGKPLLKEDGNTYRSGSSDGSFFMRSCSSKSLSATASDNDLAGCN